MEKVIVKIKNKRRNSNWHDINRNLNPVPKENNRSFGIRYNGSRSEPKRLCFGTLHNFPQLSTLMIPFHTFDFSLVNSRFHRKISACSTCGFEFW